MRKLTASALLFVWISFRAFAGTDYTLVKELPFEDAWMSTDKIGNAYVIAINQLFKFDTDGKPVSNYSQTNSGVLQSADCSDPLKLVLFYPDFARVQTLNNKLSLESSVELRSLGFIYPALVCQSANLGYWIFDLATFQLKKVDPSLKVIYESGNLQQVLGLTLKPKHLLESDNFVYVNDPQHGILVFDMYGVYYKTIPIHDVQSLQVREHRLYYVRGNTFYSFDEKKMEESEIKIPPHGTLLNARIEQNRLYLLTTTTLSIFSF
jgi:hypothetical protein